MSKMLLTERTFGNRYEERFPAKNMTSIKNRAVSITMKQMQVWLNTESNIGMRRMNLNFGVFFIASEKEISYDLIRRVIGLISDDN